MDDMNADSSVSDIQTSGPIPPTHVFPDGSYIRYWVRRSDQRIVGCLYNAKHMPVGQPFLYKPQEQDNARLMGSRRRFQNKHTRGGQANE